MSDIFAGTKQIREAVTVIGWIAIGHAALDDHLNYLLWQLKAFGMANRLSRKSDTPAEAQALLRNLRKQVPRSDIKTRVDAVSRCLGTGKVAARLNELPDGAAGAEQWQALADRVIDLTKRRNTAVHSAVSWSAGSVSRAVGGLLDGVTAQIDPARDQQLANALGTLRTDLGMFTTSLGYQLPFAGDDKIITFAPAVVTLPT